VSGVGSGARQPAVLRPRTARRASSSWQHLILLEGAKEQLKMCLDALSLEHFSS
jgi:hypothetical protein